MRNFLLKPSTYLPVLLLAFNFGFCEILLAQGNHEVDSLLHVFSSLKDDTNKVNDLLSQSETLMRTSDYVSAIVFEERGLKLANELNYKKGIIRSYIILGWINWNQGNYPVSMNNYLISLRLCEEMGYSKGLANTYNGMGLTNLSQGNYAEAQNNFESSMVIRKKINDEKGIADLYNNIGNIYLDQGKYNEALFNYTTAIKYREKLSDKLGISASYNNLGIVYHSQGKYSEALKYYLLSLALDEELGDKNGVARSNINIGMIYEAQGNFQNALKYFFDTNKVCIEIGNKECIAGTYNNIGDIYEQLGNEDDALKYYLLSLELSKNMGDKQQIANTSDNIGAIYRKQENYTEALRYHKLSLEISKELDDQPGIAGCLANLGELNIEMNEPDSAKKYYQDAIIIFKEMGLKDRIAEAYLALSRVDSILGDSQEALAQFKLYALFKDSLQHESYNSTLTEMQTKYETEKKDKDIQKLENDQKISGLQLRVQQESLRGLQFEKDKIHAKDLLNIKQIQLLDNEKALQVLQIEKKEADLVAQKAETGRKQDQLILLNKEGEMQAIKLKKQTLLKNYLLAGLLLFGLLSFFVYKYYLTRQRLKLQMMRNKIASDLHDDVGSTLSSISIFSTLAQEQSKEVIPLLETIGKSSRQMLDAMADIVWTINPENDQFENIILRMRSFAYQLLGAKKINFEFKTDDDLARLKLPMDVRKNLYLIFKEAANNMAKYSGASKALFSIQEEKDALILLIQDNGIGFDPNGITEGNGLKNMKRRAKEIGAILLINSFPGSGTTIELRIAV
ncbi:MAG: tetratricopeptide repeat protein [Saprospiraceae bacterium]